MESLDVEPEREFVAAGLFMAILLSWLVKVLLIRFIALWDKGEDEPAYQADLSASLDLCSRSC